MNYILYYNKSLKLNSIPLDIINDTYNAYIDSDSFIVAIYVNSMNFVLKNQINEFELHACTIEDFNYPLQPNHFFKGSRNISFKVSDLIYYNEPLFPDNSLIPIPSLGSISGNTNQSGILSLKEYNRGVYTPKAEFNLDSNSHFYFGDIKTGLNYSLFLDSNLIQVNGKDTFLHNSVNTVLNVLT